MRKKFAAFVCALIICFTCVLPAFGTSAEPTGFVPGNYPRLMDFAELLTEAEQTDILARLNEISEQRQIDTVIVTTDSTDGKTVAEYADDTFDRYGFGYGDQKDGILLLISMEDRDWYISTSGYAISVFTDAGIEYIGERMLGSLSEGDYADAFNIFIDQCDDFIRQADEYEPYDSGDFPREPLPLSAIPVSLVIGFIIALIAVAVMKSKLKSVRSQPAADSYIKSGSLKITDSRDLFLYRTVSRVARPKDNDSGGGSSTHVSSSGSTHGGGGGKF